MLHPTGALLLQWGNLRYSSNAAFTLLLRAAQLPADSTVSQGEKADITLAPEGCRCTSCSARWASYGGRLPAWKGRHLLFCKPGAPAEQANRPSLAWSNAPQPQLTHAVPHRSLVALPHTHTRLPLLPPLLPCSPAGAGLPGPLCQEPGGLLPGHHLPQLCGGVGHQPAAAGEALLRV